MTMQQSLFMLDRIDQRLADLESSLRLAKQTALRYRRAADAQESLAAMPPAGAASMQAPMSGADGRRLEREAESSMARLDVEVQAQIVGLQAERRETIRELPPSTIALYTHLLDACDGCALAAVRKRDADRLAFACGVCSESVPIYLVNRVVSSNEPVQCPSCSRILYRSPSEDPNQPPRS